MKRKNLTLNEMDELVKTKPIYKIRGLPFYHIHLDWVKGYLSLLADKIGKSGELDDILGTYPIKCYGERGYQQSIKEDFGPAGLLSFRLNIRTLSNLIVSIERSMNFKWGDVDRCVNAFQIGRAIDRIGYEFELPVWFYNIEVNEEIDYKEYRRLKNLIENSKK